MTAPTRCARAMCSRRRSVPRGVRGLVATRRCTGPTKAHAVNLRASPVPRGSCRAAPYLSKVEPLAHAPCPRRAVSADAVAEVPEGDTCSSGSEDTRTHDPRWADPRPSATPCRAGSRRPEGPRTQLRPSVAETSRWPQCWWQGP
eukprot:scaffold158532_cov28-Tisochrysis_lutea.AAC.1